LKLQWSAASEEDRGRIFDFLAERNPAAALRMDERIDEAVEHLIEYPQIGREGRVEGTRELVIGNTPYIAAYKVGVEGILILRLLHGAQLWPDDIALPND